MENNDYNLELAKYIWSILKTQITIFMSWGVEPKSMKVIEKGLEFHCQGFKHTGKVQIVLDEGKDLFEVHLISEDGPTVKLEVQLRHRLPPPLERSGKGGGRRW